MDFSKIISWLIPQGKVKSISIGGVKVWQKKEEKPDVPDTPDQTQLLAPTISISGNTLLITDNSGGLATSFGILVNGVVEGYSSTTNYDLNKLNLNVDTTYEITVIAKASGYIDSEPSNAVSYVVGSVEETYTIPAGTYLFNSTPTFPDGVPSMSGNINFVSNNENFITMGFSLPDTSGREIYYYNGSEYISVAMPLNDESEYQWTNEVYRTINLATDQTVSKEFYEWFTANATQLYQINAGTYVFKETPDMSSYNKYIGHFSFVSNTANYNKILYLYGERIEYADTGESEKNIEIYTISNGWLAEVYRTITVETDQIVVSEEFYNWFVENTLITFTIDGTSYQAEEGMTWQQWVESSYNTGGWSVSGDKIFTIIILTDYWISNVVVTDIIIADKVYSVHTGSGSN